MFPVPAHATGQRPRRRLNIQPFRRGDVAPDFAVNSCLALSSAFRDCYAGKARDLNFETLYRCAYDVVLVGHGEALYTQVATTMASEAEKLAASLLLDHAGETDGAFLRGLLGRWKTHSAAVAMINDVVVYMDAVFVPKRDKAPVRELGHRAWFDGVLRSGGSTTVWARLRAVLLEISRRERAGEAVDSELCGLMAGAARMLVDLGGGAYEALEAPFLDEAARFYAVESVRLMLELGSSSCGEYLGEVESMADAESARASRCGLDAARTGEKAAAVVLREMVEKDGVAMARLVAGPGGLAAMLVEGRCSDMARMHRLLGRVRGGVAAMRSALEAHFREIRERAGDDERVLSREKDRYRGVIDGVFHGEVSFHAALNSCFG